MAEKKASSSRKKPVSQKRVAIVLASLVGTMTLSAGALLIMEGGLGASPLPAAAVSRGSVRSLIRQAPLQPGAWNYIIIYESGDLAASAASLADGRLSGVESPAGTPKRRPANFHFVVDSAQSKSGALDGELEVSPSWLNQSIGIPHAGWPDPSYHAYTVHHQDKAVGVCVAGNLSKIPYTDAQYRTLVQLTKELQAQLRVPKEAIFFQWELAPNNLHASPAQTAFAEDFRKSLD